MIFVRQRCQTHIRLSIISTQWPISQTHNHYGILSMRRNHHPTRVSTLLYRTLSANTLSLIFVVVLEFCAHHTLFGKPCHHMRFPSWRLVIANQPGPLYITYIRISRPHFAFTAIYPINRDVFHEPISGGRKIISASETLRPNKESQHQYEI